MLLAFMATFCEVRRIRPQMAAGESDVWPVYGITARLERRGEARRRQSEGATAGGMAISKENRMRFEGIGITDVGTNSVWVMSNT
jgi:hypothetical protein